jgi:hypothetical protein
MNDGILLLLIFVVGFCWLLVTRLEVKKNLISVNRDKKTARTGILDDGLDSQQYGCIVSTATQTF